MTKENFDATMNEQVNVGDEICFFEGKNENPVAYTWMGKVILCKHKIPLGYARVKTVEDRGRFFLVTAEHIVKDVYSEIDYEDFIKVLPLHGFKIGYDKPFQVEWKGEEPKTEHQIFAYNLTNHVVIVADSFTLPNGRMKFNSIDTYCPGLGFHKYHRNRHFSSGSRDITRFNLEYGFGCKDLLSWVNQQMEGITAVWPKNDYPMLWNYAEARDDETVKYDENGDYVFGKLCLRKLLDAPVEVLEKVFDGCEWAKELLEERKVA